jgi:hypothetical protein
MPPANSADARVATAAAVTSFSMATILAVSCAAVATFVKIQPVATFVLQQKMRRRRMRDNRLMFYLPFRMEQAFGVICECKVERGRSTILPGPAF